MKKYFEEPEVLVERMMVEDIITASFDEEEDGMGWV